MADKEKSMKQLFQNMKNGETSIKELPIPHPGKGNALVQTAFSHFLTIAIAITS